MTNWFALVRTKFGKTQRDIAVALNKTDKTVSNWELRGGDPKLTYSQWRTLCYLFGCTFEELGAIKSQAETEKD